MVSQTKRHHGGWVRLCLTLVLILLIGLGTFNYFRSIPVFLPVTKITELNLPNAPIIWPQTAGAQAAIGAVGYGVLGSSGAQVKQPTASTAKLITALLVLNKYPLTLGQTTSPVISLGPSDVALYQQYLSEQGSVAKVIAGEQISEYQALQAMLLPSANNIADSMAIWAFGSLANYTKEANSFVAGLGLSNTTVGSDASGFLPNSVSTATDLVKLGLAALSNPVIAQIVAEKQATIPVAGTVYNVNTLLARSDVVGIKTGNSNQAGGVYIFAAKYQPDRFHNLIIVGSVEGAANLSTGFGNAVDLINFAETNLTLNTIIHQGQTVGYYAIPWLSSKVNISTSSSLNSIVWSDTSSQPIAKIDSAKYPLVKGSKVGLINIFHTSSNQDSTNLTIDHNIPSPPWWWRIIRFRV